MTDSKQDKGAISQISTEGNIEEVIANKLGKEFQTSKVEAKPIEQLAVLDSLDDNSPKKVELTKQERIELPPQRELSELEKKIERLIGGRK